ncbi:(S)-2-haloacid dehalogenase [Rhodobacteraceae bacterium THAF1]|uniref:haloacid dehalogenase type II n=1 Tax=Palleronia sp. THAF1 TaxID=2587842 RepID=UPI000F3C6AD7|nr:haloacid dehalogenase type II [Palleronia sp. THAF1]QFU08417.1 (S)-2-haloacid dehalogenase [Palleronia sp. THAF1]VDC29229.1 (S)-2-haloacid dehalogenase [Rhodobacteraceae bacterium THAF1]
MSQIDALIFDVFGTCVDWLTPVAAEVASAIPGTDGMAVALAWRAEYDPAMRRVRDGGRGYVPLEVLHRENLDRVLDRFDLNCADPDTLTNAWERLTPWPDTVPGLTAMRARRIIAPCSNGSIALMTRLARHAGLPWDCILGAEIAQDYKPKAQVYLASCAALRLPPERVMMVAAHNGDLHAAGDAGLRTAFVPRPTEYGPDQADDLEPTGDWDAVAPDFVTLSEMLP